jgi:hypothetical protein
MNMVTFGLSYRFKWIRSIDEHVTPRASRNNDRLRRHQFGRRQTYKTVTVPFNTITRLIRKRWVSRNKLAGPYSVNAYFQFRDYVQREYHPQRSLILRFLEDDRVQIRKDSARTSVYGNFNFQKTAAQIETCPFESDFRIMEAY